MRTNKISKEQLIPLLEAGKTTRQIGELLNISSAYVSYLVRKYNLIDILKYKKPNIIIDYFEKIDTKEKAYVLGFLLADGTISTNGSLVLSIALQDREIVDFISKQLGTNTRIYTKLDKEKRIFPSANISIKIPKIYNDFLKWSGGKLKQDRTIPNISKNLEPYLILGFFDGDGCIIWGRRKDRNRVWNKISFTSAYKMLCVIQNILLKQNISTRLYKKSDENCYILETTNKQEISKFLNYIYKDLIVLRRKYNNAQALRLELGELGEP